MCMEDVKIGRATGFAISTVTLPLAGTVTPLCAQSEHRIGLIIASGNNAPFNATPQGLTVSATVGIRLGSRQTIGADVNTNGSVPLDFNIQDHGRLVTAPWNGASIGVADAIVTVIELFLEREN